MFSVVDCVCVVTDKVGLYSKAQRFFRVGSRPFVFSRLECRLSCPRKIIESLTRIMGIFQSLLKYS